MRERGRGEKLIYIGYVALILSPLVVLLVQSLALGKNLFLGVPTWSDELDYFREIFSFSKNGFGFGGSLFAGHEAQIGPLGAHSFSPVVAWGLFSLIGWNEHSILLCNLLVLCISFVIFAFVVKPKGKNLVLVLLAAYLYGPLNLYLHTSMMEVMIYAWVIVYFSLFCKYTDSRRELFFWLALAAGVIVTLMRMPYVVMLFPLIWARTDYKFNLKTLKNIAIYVLLFFVVYKIYNVFCADYPDWVTSKIGAADSLKGKLYLVVHNAFGNLHRYFSFSATPVQVALRYAYGLMIVILLLASVFELKNGTLKRCFKKNYFSLFVMLGGLWAIMIVLYDIKDYRDFRTFSIVLFWTLIYIFTQKTEAGCDKWLRASGVIVVVFVLAFSMGEGLTKDRYVAANVDADDSWVALEEAKGAGPESVGTTWDINWGDIALQKSVPDYLGYKVFLEGETGDLSVVDYVLTTDSYLESHPEMKDKIEFKFKTKDSYSVYKVK